MEEGTRNTLSDRDIWLRAPVLVLFYLLLILVTPVLVLISVVGWFTLLIRGRVPDEISDLGRSLAAWYEQTARYLTGAASRRPFPFEDLDCPTDEPDLATAGTVAPGARNKPVAEPGGLTSGSKQTIGKKKTAKKTGKKKTGKKKAGKKKAGRKSGVKEAENTSQPVMQKETDRNE